MAVWQADFYLIPTGPWLPDYYERLDALAPRGRSWSGDLETWGQEDGNRVDVHLEAGQPSDGVLRLDMRAWDAAFTIGVLELLKQQRFGLEDEAGNWVEPVLGEVALAARVPRRFGLWRIRKGSSDGWSSAGSKTCERAA